MLGPTGCGKTLLRRHWQRFWDVPFAIADATALTEAGYVGEDVENILLRLFRLQMGISNVPSTESFTLMKLIRLQENQRIRRSPEMYPVRVCSRHFLRS